MSRYYSLSEMVRGMLHLKIRLHAVRGRIISNLKNSVLQCLDEKDFTSLLMIEHVS